MASLTESVVVDASLAEAWDLYFEPQSWPAWVDGFGAVRGAEGYPAQGSTLIWSSTPAGRGEVHELVLEHEPRRRHRIEFSDPGSSGTQLTTFEIQGSGTRVALELEYRLAKGGLLRPVTDRLFVRGQLRQALQRTLLRFKHEAEQAARDPDASPSPSADQ